MNDHLLYLASTGIVAFTCLLVSGLLLSLKTLRESTIPKYRTACKVSRLGLGIGRHRAYLHLVFRHGRANHHGVVLLPHPANQRLASVAVHVPAHPLIQGKERDPEEYPPPRHAYDRAYRSLHDRLSLPGGCPYVSFRRMVG